MTSTTLGMYQTITNVNFGFPTKFKFTAGDNHFASHPELRGQGYYQEFFFSSPASFSDGPLVQIDGDMGTGEGNWLHGSDDHDPSDPTYFTMDQLVFNGHDTVLLTRQLVWNFPFPASITGTDVWELTIPGFSRTFRTDDPDWDGTQSWAPLDASYTLTAGTQYDCTWIKVA